MEKSYCYRCDKDTENEDFCIKCGKYFTCLECADSKDQHGIINTGNEEEFICGICAFKMIKICYIKKLVKHEYTKDGIKYLFRKLEE